MATLRRLGLCLCAALILGVIAGGIAYRVTEPPQRFVWDAKGPSEGPLNPQGPDFRFVEQSALTLLALLGGASLGFVAVLLATAKKPA